MTSINRRQFLALGVGAAAAMAVPGQAGAATAKAWNERTSRPIRKYDESMDTACLACGSHCTLTAYRQSGKVASLIPARGGCPRGIQAFEALYDGERLTSPLKRVGPRGSGKWQAITWDEALDTLAAALRNSGQEAVADLGRPDPLAPALLSSLGFARVATSASTVSWGALKAKKALYGRDNVRPALDEAKTIILWGFNPLDGGDDFAGYTADLVKAKANGAKLVLVSPVLGATGTYANRWIPVRPGAEPLAAAALANALLKAGANAGSLKEAFGLTVEELSAGFSSLPKDAAAKAGLSSEDAEFLVERFFAGSVAVLSDGSGLKDAKAMEGVAALLNVLGGTVALSEKPLTGFEAVANAPREKITGQLLKGTRSASVYLAYRSNPVYTSPGGKELQKAFTDGRNVGYLVSFDTTLTETGLLSDLILPAAADLESWGVLSGRSNAGKAAFVLAQPVQLWDTEAELLRDEAASLETLFSGQAPSALPGTRQLGDVLAALAARLGKPTPFKSSKDAAVSAAARLGLGNGMVCAPVKTERLPLKADGQALLASLRSLKTSESSAGLKLVPITVTELDPASPNSAIAREIKSEAPLYLNSATAKKLGLNKHDHVELSFGSEKIHAAVFPVQTIHPDGAGFPFDYGHWASGSAASLKTGEDALPRLTLDRKEFLLTAVKGRHGKPRSETSLWWREKGPGESLAAASQFLQDDEGALLWRELPVSLKKA